MPDSGPALLLRGPVVLVGLMGSGKSSAGAKLARALAVPFIDTDGEIELRQGRTVADVFAADGEAAFRRMESALLAELLARGEPCVVATGGGAVLSENSRRLLRDHATVVWLRASPGMLAHRVADDGTRPLLGDDPRAALERLSAERDHRYREVADCVVDIDNLDRAAVLARLVLAVGGTGVTGEVTS
jgi:shikimate kinase